MDNRSPYSFDNIIAKRELVFVSFLLFSLLFRFLSFSYSVIDHDESTYMIIADQLNNGAEMYTDVIDTKPVGIFMIFSFIQLVFGKSVIALRLFSCLILALSAYFLTRVHYFLSFNKKLSFFTGLIFIIAFSAYRMGLSINTELYFTFFTIAGLLCFIKANQRKIKHLWFVGGLLIGLGFIIKYVVLADYIAFLTFFILITYKTPKFRKMGFNLGLSGVGFIIPFLMLHIYFLMNNRFPDFYHASYEVVSNYPSTLSFNDSLFFILKFHLLFLPFAIFYYIAGYTIDSKNKLLQFSSLWLALTLLIIVIPGKNFKHYYLQALPALSLLVPSGIDIFLRRYNLSVKKQTRIVVGLFLVALLIAFINQSHFYTEPDVAKQITKDLEGEVKQGDLIWADKKYHIVPYFLDLKPPSRYVHPTIIFEHADAFSIDTEQEVKNILRKHPRFIIHRKDNEYFINHPDIQKQYVFYKDYKKTTVLERKY